MDTKWRSKKVIIITILLLSFGLSMFASSMTSGRYILTGSYFESNDFQNNTFYNYQELLRVFGLNNWSEEVLKSQITVTDDEIEEHRYRYGNLSEQISSINDQYESRIEELKEAGNTEGAEALQKERDEKIQDITLNFSNDEHVSAKIRQEKEQAIDSVVKQLKATENTWNRFSKVFDYYLVDEETGEVFTSLSKEEASDYGRYFAENKMRFVATYTEDHPLGIDANIAFSQYVDLNTEYLPNLESDFHYYTGYIGIPKSVPAANSLVAPIEQFEKFRIFYIGLAVAGGMSLLLGFIFLFFIKPFTNVNRLQIKLFNKLPFDIRTVALLLSSAVGLMSLIPLTDISYYVRLRDSVFYTTYTVGAGLLGFSIFLVVTFIYLNSIKGSTFEELWKETILHKLMRAIRDAFIVRNVGIQLVVLLGCLVILVLFMLFALTVNSGIIMLFIFLIALTFSVVILYIIFKHTGYFNIIVKMIHDMANGKNVDEIKVPGKTVFAQVATDLNSIKDGVKTSQREQVKSERLKTELITNVSHDLRTPLTSIITYTDLLKNDNLTVEERNDYVAIIDRKSKRLKVLIDDLFEASKMATGNIELNKSKVEIVQLLQQALAEHNEQIEQSQLQFRVTYDDQPIEVHVDGQKIWRVFDNLINNILKYSMPNSRVYVAVKNRPDTVEISFKNVSLYELGDNVDELFERFKRGDQSRHTEGSGLGLAIAKSIIDLHESEMDIAVDGDLFKVTIRLNK
ncbi:sensor histidine kinase [Bacillus sp. AGMB 02131]|uniref:histidine kinase n=1 Tax=Peribacillus faecalis TaxID=2772559 RepID=A0A927H9L6_9BACI|nr:HAMP domain-containing sensor histidine kinase [Peribacillus faecalis]MBD3107019.1 sensor histidine kinase [Peribacillus faecalis]